MLSLVVFSFLLCSSIRSLYTGVLLHEPENSPILLRAQQNKGVFFVCSLSGMVIPRAFLCIDRKHDHQRAEGISWVGDLLRLRYNGHLKKN